MIGFRQSLMAPLYGASSWVLIDALYCGEIVNVGP